MDALFDHFYIVGVGASVMLGLLLTVIVVRQKRADKGPNRMMAVLVLVLMASVLLNSFLSSFLPQAYPNLLAFPEPFLLLIGGQTIGRRVPRRTDRPFAPKSMTKTVGCRRGSVSLPGVAPIPSCLMRVGFYRSSTRASSRLPKAQTILPGLTS